MISQHERDAKDEAADRARRRAARLAALEESRIFHEELLRARGGKLFRPAADVVRELRDERDKQLQ